MEMLLQDNNIWIVLLIMLWILPWKGVALWKAARLSHRGWFIAILIIHTFAILDIIYIFFVASKYKVETTEEVEEQSSAAE